MAKRKELFYRINLEGSGIALDRAEDIAKELKLINAELKVTGDDDAYVKLKEKQLQLLAAQKDVRKEQNILIKQFQGVAAGVGSYRDLEGRLEKAREAFRRLGKEERETGDEAEKLQQEMQQLSAELKDIDEQMDLSFRKIGDYTGGIEDAVKKLLPDLGGLQDAFAGIGGGGVGGALALGTGLFAVGSFLVDATQNIREFVDELDELRREANAITREVGESLDNITVSSRALSVQFGADSTEIIQAANAVKNEFGIEFDEVFGLIEGGFVRGLDKGGEFLDNLREYAPQFADAKFSAQELFEVLELQLTKGVYSDKGVDAIKEAGLSLRELTQPTLDALEAIGLSGEKIQEIISEKGLGAGIAAVSKRLQDFDDDSAEVGQVLADIFKGAGEDAGVGFIKTLGDVDGALQEVDEETQRYIDRQQNLLDSNKELAAAQNEVAKRFGENGEAFEAFGNRLKTFGIDLLLRIVDIFKPLGQALGNFFGLITKAGRALGLFNEDADVSAGLIDLLTRGLNNVVMVLTFFFNTVSNGIKITRDWLLQFKLVRDVAAGVQQLFLDAPKYFAGFQAAGQQAIENLRGYFDDLVLRARIGFLELQKLNPFGGAAEAAQEEIDKLQSQRDSIKEAGRSVGDAFREGFAEGGQGAGAVVTGGSTTFSGRSGGGGGDGLSQAQKDELERQAKAEEARQEKLKKLREKAASDEAKFELDKAELLRVLTAKMIDADIALMQEGLAKERALLQNAYDDRIADLQQQEQDFLRQSEKVGRSPEQVQDVLNKIAELEKQAKEQLNADSLQLDKDFAVKERTERLESIKEQLFDIEQGVEDAKATAALAFDKGEIFDVAIFEATRKGLVDQIKLLNEEIEAEEVVLAIDADASDENLKELLRLRKQLNVDLKELDEEREQAAQESAQAQIESFNDVFQQVGNFAMQGLDVVQGFFNAASERRQEQFDSEIATRQANIENLQAQMEGATEQEKEELKQRVVAEQNSIKAINKFKEEEQKKQAKRDKTFAIIKSIINTALAISNALASSPPPASFILAAIVGALGVAQTAVIAAQPAAKGGIAGEPTEMVDVVSGQKITSRQNIRTTTAGDNVLVAAKRGEVILNAAQQRMLGGAKTFKKIGVAGFAQGGVVGDLLNAPNIQESGSMAEVLAKLDAKTDAIDRRVDKLKVFIVQDDLADNDSEKAFIEQQTTLG